MSILAVIIISAIILLILAVLAVRIMTRPLPEWNGLYGEKYLEWKKNKKLK